LPAINFGAANDARSTLSSKFTRAALALRLPPSRSTRLPPLPLRSQIISVVSENLTIQSSVCSPNEHLRAPFFPWAG
jgi:hypothetical protein